MVRVKLEYLLEGNTGLLDVSKLVVAHTETEPHCKRAARVAFKHLLEILKGLLVVGFAELDEGLQPVDKRVVGKIHLDVF